MKAMRSIGISPGLSLTAVLLFNLSYSAFAQSATGGSVPVVTIAATTPVAHWNGGPGVFTVFRSGDTSQVLNVWCGISGTASNGVDYRSIGAIVQLAAA